MSEGKGRFRDSQLRTWVLVVMGLGAYFEHTSSLPVCAGETTFAPAISISLCAIKGSQESANTAPVLAAHDSSSDCNAGLKVAFAPEALELEWPMQSTMLMQKKRVEVEVLVVYTHALVDYLVNVEKARPENVVSMITDRVDGALRLTSTIATQGAQTVVPEPLTASRPGVVFRRKSTTEPLLVSGTQEPSELSFAVDPDALFDRLRTRNDGEYEEVYCTDCVGVACAACREQKRHDLLLFLTPNAIASKTSDPLGSLTGAISMPLVARDLTPCDPVPSATCRFNADRASLLVVRWQSLTHPEVLPHWIGHLLGCAHTCPIVTPAADAACGYAKNDLVGHSVTAFESIGASAACHYEFTLGDSAGHAPRRRLLLLATRRTGLPVFDPTTTTPGGETSFVMSFGEPCAGSPVVPDEARELLESARYVSHYSEWRGEP
jgi:hypothetical protein